MTWNSAWFPVTGGM